MICSCHKAVWWKFPILRLLFECKYTATSVQYVNLELGLQDPPLNVYAEGPLQVQLKLASGICLEKGCTGIPVLVCHCFGICWLFPANDLCTNVFLLIQWNHSIIPSTEKRTILSAKPWGSRCMWKWNSWTGGILVLPLFFIVVGQPRSPIHTVCLSGTFW